MAASLKLSELTALTAVDDADLLLVTDSSATQSKKVTFANLKSSLTSGLSVDDLRTAVGTTLGSGHMGTFTGSTIGDNGSVKAALQALETATELRATAASPQFTGNLLTHIGDGTLPVVHRLQGGFPDFNFRTNGTNVPLNQNEGRLLWEDAGGGGVAAIKQVMHPDSPMRFFVGGITASEERLRINANGRVGIGETNPQAQLHVGGSVLVKADFPDFQMRSGGERRLIFEDAGGGAEAAIKSSGANLDFFVGGVASGNEIISIDADSVDFKQTIVAEDGITLGGANITTWADLKDDIDLDHIHTLTGVAAGTEHLGTFTGSTIADSTTIKAALQALETSTETKFATAGGTLTGNFAVGKSFPDITLKAGDERRILFSDAGGSAEAAIKSAGSNMDIFVGGVASGNEIISIDADSVDFKQTIVAEDGFTMDSVALTTIQTSGESFADNDTSLMTSAAINDLIGSSGGATTLSDLGVTSTAAELNILDGVTATAAELNILDGVTATTAELNILDGVTSTAAELNILDGVTSTAAELNILDGVTSTAAELNILDGVTATTAEVNVLDGATAGTAVASKAVVLDSNKDITGIRNFTITGNLSVQGTTTTVDTVTMEAANAIVFEGATADDHETTLTIVDPNADRTIKLPNQSGCLPVLAADSTTAITATPEELNVLDGITATVAELNILDGVTSTAAELNILDGVTATAAELNILDGVTATAAELNALDGITSTVAELNILDGVTSTAAEINVLDGVTAGTVSASKAVVVDSNKDITGFRNLTLTGWLIAPILDISGNVDIDGITNLDAVDIDGATQIDGTVTVGVDDTGYDVKFFGATSGAYMLWDESEDDLVLAGAAGLDIAGDIDVDGTTNLDAVDIDGATQIDGTVTVGVDDTGYDVKFFGASASAYMLWDESADDLILAGAAGLVVPDGQFTLGSTAVTSTAAELNILDGVTSTAAELNILDGVTSTTAELNILDGVTSTAAELNILDGVTSTAAELNILDGVTATTAELNILDGVTSTAAELNVLDGVTAGTVAASKAVVVDSNKDAASFRNVTLTGELDAATLDISGDADIDGTTNLDAVDIDGATQIDATVTVGVDDTGYDVKFFGATSGAYMLWDESEDDLVLAGAAGLDIAGNIDVDGTTNLDAVDIDGATQIDGTVTVGVDDTGYDVKFFGATASAFLLWDESADDLILSGAAGLVVPEGQFTLGSTAVTSTAAELNLVDGITAGTVSASKAVIVDSDKDVTGFRNVTATGEVDCATLDVSSTSAFADNVTIENQKEIRFAEGSGNGSNYTGFRAPAALTANVTFTLPDGDGTNGQVITTNGSGTLSWSDAPSASEFAGVTAGTVSASKGVEVDSNKDITGFRNVTLTGELDTATLDVSGDADIDGTTNLDAVDIDGATQIDATVTVGVDDTGYDVKFFGATSGAYMLWDESEDDLVLAGAAGLDIAGDIDVDGTANLDNVDIDGNTNMAGNLTFSGGATNMVLTDNTSGAMDIKEGTTSYMKFDTTNGSELITVAKDTNFTGAVKLGGTAITSTAAELNILDGVTSTAAELNILDGVTSTAAELNILDGVTSTAAELNILDGVTATTAELNILDGVTSTAAELNILDGVTATAAELNLLDGATDTTWTATLEGSTGNPGSKVTATGQYARMGKMVIATVHFNSVDTSNYTGDISISGLPVTSKDTATAMFMGNVYNNGMISGATDSVQALVADNGTTISFLENANGSALTWGTVGAGKSMRVQVVYISA